MTGPVVVAFDGTDVGEDALVLGGALGAATGHPLLVVDVHPAEPLSVLPGIGSEWVRETRTQAQSILERARRLARPGIEAEYRPVPATSVAAGLDRVARKADAQAIVLGSSHHGVLRRVGVGKTAGRLLQGAAAPVAVAPRGVRDLDLEIEVVGCAYVPSPEAHEALARAATIARAAGARLRLFTVVAHSIEIRDADPDRESRTVAEARLPLEEAARKAASLLPAELDVEVAVLEGGVVDALSAITTEECQLLLCGSRGYGPVGRVLLGGVSGRLVRRAMCPVMVVPRGADED